MAVHVMVDLETFGVGRKAVPISIGAVKFNATHILDKFHVGIDPASATARGLKIDAGTAQWWLDDERRDAWHEWLTLEKHDLGVALDGFAMWINAPLSQPNGDVPFPDDPLYGAKAETLWGNGVNFDNEILRDAYMACGLENPVSSFNDRCYRTVKSLRPDIKIQRMGTHHSALDDAESQAHHLQDLARALGVVL